MKISGCSVTQFNCDECTVLSRKPLGNFLHHFLSATPSRCSIYVRFLVRLDLDNYKFSTCNQVTNSLRKRKIIIVEVIFF